MNGSIDILFTAHDELIVESEESVLELLEQLAAIPPEWCPDLPIKAKGWENDFYRK